MTLTLTKLTSNDAAALLARQLECVADPRALQMAVVAEHIRGALYAHAARTSGLEVSPAVHTTRLLTGVRKTLNLIWTKSAVVGAVGQGDCAQLTLDSLALVGDTVDTGGGFWIGTPLRLVGNAEDASLAVFGTLPSPLVKTLTGFKVSSVGGARFVVRLTTSSDKKLDSYIQSADDWLGQEEPLDVWTRRLLEQLRARLAPSGDVTADQLEVYAPDLFAARRQNGRWFEARQLTQAIAGPRLCRPLVSVAYEWNRPFYLAEIGFRSGQATITRSAPVDYGLTQRLRFGLDRQLQVPRRVTLMMKAGTFDLDLPYDLPNPENRVLGLGWPSPSRAGRRTFHTCAKPVLARAFDRLGVIIETRRGADV
jgi:hypothetical protein